MLKLNTTILAAVTALISAICIYSVINHEPLLRVMTNADQLTIPSLADDLLRNPLFDFSTWSLSRAPYFVPDGLIVLSINSIVQDPIQTVAIYSVIHTTLIILSAMFIYYRIFEKSETRGIYLFCFVFVFYIIINMSKSPWYWPVSASFFLPISHAGPMIVGIVLLTVFFERMNFANAILMTIISALFIFSDRLFFAYFSVPFCILYMIYDRSKYFRDSILVVFSQLFALIIGYQVLGLFVVQHSNLIRYDFINQLQVISSAVWRSPLLPWLIHLTALGVAAILSVRALTFRIFFADRAVPTYEPYLIYLALSSLAGAGVTFLLWSHSDAHGSLRYGVPFQFFVIFLSAWVIAKGLIAVKRASNSVFLAIIVILPVIPLSSIALSFPGNSIYHDKRAADHQLAEALVQCKERLGLKAGLASYGFARRISLLTGWEMHVAQLQPWGPPRPFFWGNNALWFYFDRNSGMPIQYNFVIANDINHESLVDMYGIPDSIHRCDIYDIAFFGNSDVLTERIKQRMQGSPAQLIVEPLLRSDNGAGQNN